MRSFDIVEWCDFVRGVAGPDAESAMRRALAAGDSDAHRTVELLRRVAAVVRRDAEAAVPGYAERAVKAIAALQPQAVRRTPTLRRLPFQVTFDSFLHAAPAGTRTLGPAPRHLVLASDDYTVDVRLESESEPPGGVVVGQLLRRAGEGRPVPDVPVLVRADGRIVALTATSRFGEFQLDGLPPGDLDLSLLVEDRSYLHLPLGEPGAAPRDGGVA